MKVLILGAGAVGLCLAARLSQVCEVKALCRPRQHHAIRDRGFHMTGIWGEGNYRLDTLTEVPAGERFDYCILSSKSGATAQLCQAHAALLSETTAISLQNGIGNEEILSDYCTRVIGGTIITGFEWRGEGAVAVTVEAGPVRLGRFPRGDEQAVTPLIGLFRSAGIEALASSDIRSHIWSKTLYNCALNPLGAILGVAYGELAHPRTWGIIEALVEEVFRVAGAEGVKLPWDASSDYLRYLREVQLPATAQHHSSMLQDIRRGYRTEIDFINGAIVRLGEKHGLPVPVNSTLSGQIGFITRNSA